jgi:hypothetical protein
VSTCGKTKCTLDCRHALLDRDLLHVSQKTRLTLILRTEPKGPFLVPQIHFLPLCICGFARAQQRAAAFARCGKAGAKPVRILGVRVCVVVVLHQCESEDIVAELAGENTEKGALELGVRGWGNGERGSCGGGCLQGHFPSCWGHGGMELEWRIESAGVESEELNKWWVVVFYIEG